MLWIGIAFLHLCGLDTTPAWGFYGHKKINRHAVYSLPPEMFGFYRKHIDFIADHAVDPDKRRYATKHEGVRHYIDIDVWGSYPFDSLPRNFNEALLTHARYYQLIDGDTLEYALERKEDTILLTSDRNNFTLPYRTYRKIWDSIVMPQYYEDEWKLSLTHMDSTLLEEVVHIQDRFSPKGILPYYLSTMKNKLTKAFVAKDQKSILRLSTEIGHYIGDAHVPLHTTINYNGQYTDQVGIHGFWESRVPELFAEEQYDFLVGKASYIPDTKSYFWDIVLESHVLLPDVLGKEKELRAKWPDDQVYCYDERLGQTLRTYCPEYAAAYQKSLSGMVEKRMQETILSIASVWYTCWIDAGQPDLSDLKKVPDTEPIEIQADPYVQKSARKHE